MGRDFLRIHRSRTCVYKILYRYYVVTTVVLLARIVYYITCRNQWRGHYINVNSLGTGHHGSVLCKRIVLGQNCNASQTFAACATLRRYESTTASHKDGGHSICCNGQPGSSTNERQECSGHEGEYFCKVLIDRYSLLLISETNASNFCHMYAIIF